MEGWKRITIGKILALEYGKPLDKDKRSSDGLYPAYGANGIKCRTNEYYFDKKTIIVGRKGSAGELTLTDEKFWPLDVTYYVTYDENLYDLMFIYYLLSGLDLPKLATGVKPGINRNNIYSIEVFVPSLEEQKRIVAILDQAFADIELARAKTEQNLKNARELFESYLLQVFSQRGEGWVNSTLGGVCSFQGGSQPPKSVFSYEPKENYIRLIQIRDYKSDKHIVYIPTDKAKRFCSADDVMIGRYGPPLFQILRGIEGSYNVALIKAKPNEDVVSKGFLFYFLKNKDILQYIINASNRAAGQIGLNKATIEPYPISYPELSEQSIIVSDIEALNKKTKKLEQIYTDKLAALDNLKKSILQKAFAGELTNNDSKGAAA